jgi:hypothetical protein
MQLMNNPLAKLIFKKGGFGQTISRAETVERVNPLIKKHFELNHSYGYVIRHHDQPEVVDALRALAKTGRMDVGKLSETVLSAGGVHYNGTDLDEDDFDLGDDPTEMLFRLRDLEQTFRDAVSQELKDITHQLRTVAILELVESNSTDRLNALREMTKRLHRPSSS